MSDKETIDITISPTKTLHELKFGKEKKAIKNLNNFYEPKEISIKSDTAQHKIRYPLKEVELIEDNIELNSPKKTMEGKGKKQRKRRNNSLSSSPKFSQKVLEFNKPRSTPDAPKTTKTKTEVKSMSFSETTKDQISPTFSKLISRHEELKSTIDKSRQAFSAYKVSTFFCFNTEFIKSFGENLTKTEHSIKCMGAILENTLAEQYPKYKALKNKETAFSHKQSLEETTVEKLEKSASCSITPPPSEIGKEDIKHILEESNPSKKRKSNASKASATESGEPRVTRKRKCTVITPVAPKMVLETELVEEKEKEIHANPITPPLEHGSDSDSDVKEGEYEVRKIGDYVKRQNGYYYRVSWRGYDSDDDTFEPADHLDGCELLMEEFFYHRLKERKHVTGAEQLKTLLLPNDARVKEMLYKAFERLIQPISKATMEKGMKFVSSSKGALKSKEDVQEDILKFLSYKDPSLDRYKKSYMAIIEQLSFKDLYPERQKQLADLRAWERSMNIISSDPAPLSVENYVDLALPPLDFIYINEYHPGPGIIIHSDPVAGCECKECSALQKGCCAGQMGSYFAYNKIGRLRVSLGTPIYECNKACKCPQECTNRVVQNGRKVALSIFRTSNNRGWGVKALEVIKKDQFVSEYVGEVISSDEAEQRGMKYDTKGCTYLFDLDYNKGDLNPYTVDAVKYGNVSHFINHSCDPNLVVFNVWVNCLDPDLPKLALFAAREIKKGDEITFDYNSGSTRQISIIDKIDDKEGYFPITPTKRKDEDGDIIIPTTEFILKTPRNRVGNAGKTECKCGAANCRKFFF